MLFLLGAAQVQGEAQTSEDPFFTYTGRLNRLTYLGRMMITWVFGVVGVLFLGVGSEGIFFGGLFLLLGGVLQIGPSVQRLHDLNLSGWLFLVFLVPLINIFFGLYVFLAKGTEGPNRYGPDPLQDDETKDSTGSQPTSSHQNRNMMQSSGQTAKEGSRDAWLETGLNQMQNGNYERAEEIFGDAVRQGVSQMDEAHFRLGQVKALQGDHPRAVLDYSGALEKRESPVILYFRGLSRALLDDHEQAERDWERAIDINTGEIEVDKIDLDDLSAQSSDLKRRCKDRIRSSLYFTLGDVHSNWLDEEKTDDFVKEPSESNDGAAQEDQDQWFHSNWNDRFGPVSQSTLKAKIKDGDIERNHLVWKQGMEDWKRVDEVFDDLTIPPPIPPKTS